MTTTTTTKATEPKKTRAEEIRESKAFKNIKVKMNAKNQLTITIDCDDFAIEKLTKGSTYANLSKEYAASKNGNMILANTGNFISLEKEGFEHLGFSLSLIAKDKTVKEAIDHVNKKTEMQSLGTTTPKNGAPAMDMAEYHEFLEFKKWKAAMAAMESK